MSSVSKFDTNAWNDGMIGEYIFGTLRIMFSISSLFVENAFLLCIATWEISTSHMTRLNTKKAALLTHNIICVVTNKEDMVFWAGKALRRSPMHKQPFRDTHQHLGQLLGGIHNPRLLSLHTHKIVSQIGFHCLSLLELNLAKHSCSFLYEHPPLFRGAIPIVFQYAVLLFKPQKLWDLLIYI